MANKQKFLESAQKNIKKKQLPRAIKDLQKVVEIDPRDIRSRQRLAELYVKTNKSGEAFEQYEAVAKYYSSNGFYLKAIAIYKQMQRLDPSQISIYSRLAELNEKQGLVGNSLAELRHLVGYYEKNEMVADAIKTLEKMRDLDPGNINVQVKLAEVYANNDRVDDGLAEFKEILKQLGEKQDYDKILRLYKMFLPLFPQNDDLQKGLALTLLEKGELAKGLSILQGLLRGHSEDIELLSLLSTVYEDQADYKNARLTYLHQLKIEPNDLEVRENLVQCYLSEKLYEKALAELEDWKESFLKINRLDRLKELYESLQEVMPDNQQVLQTLDSIYEITGDGDKLLDIVSGSSDDYTSDEPADDSDGENLLSDALLGSADEDEDILVLDENDLLEEEPDALLTPHEEEGTELELKPVEESVDEDTEEFIELSLSDTTDLEAVSADDEISLDFDLDDDDDLPPADISSDLEEAEFYLQQGLFDEAEKVCNAILEGAPDNPEVLVKLEEVRGQRSVQGKAQGEASVGLQDLAAELLEDGFPELELDGEPADKSADISSREDMGPIADTPIGTSAHPGEDKVFRTDVDEQIAADDMESHYNLGIAYREMGLFDDAVAEFSKAEQDPQRFVDCQTLQGLCYIDKGDFEKGEESFKAALEAETLDNGQMLSLHYELGALYENWERPLDALDSFQRVADSDLSFRDVTTRIQTLRKALGQGEDSEAEAGGTTAEESMERKDRVSFL